MGRKGIMFQTEIRIKGKLESNYSDWFEELKVQVNSSGDTILLGNLADKSAVYGIISRMSSLGFTLISVTCEEINIPSPLQP
jgi:hypothetical protein